MIHIFKTKIHCDFIDEDHDDVRFMADLAYRLLRQIPFDELKKLVKITKTDPRSPEIKNKMNHLTTTNQAERNWLLQLERDGVVIYEASVNIPDVELSDNDIKEKASEYVDSVRNQIDSYAYLDVQEAFRKGAEWARDNHR